MSHPPKVGPSTGATTTPSAKTAIAKPALCGRETLEQNGLRDRLQRPSACALNGTRQEQYSERWRRTAQERGCREDDDARDQESLASKTQPEPAACRQHDRICDKIAG